MIVEGTLRCSMEHVKRSDGVLELIGWISTAEATRVELPLSLTIGDRSFQIFQIFSRPDLVEAEIASGHASFCVMLPIVDGMPSEGDLRMMIKDAADRDVLIHFPAHQIEPFHPTGAIDSVSGEAASGWILDPFATRQRPQLLLNGRKLADVKATIERPDIDVEVAGLGRTVGYEVSFATVLNSGSVVAHSKKPRRGLLELVSSGFVLSSMRVTIERGRLVDFGRPHYWSARTPPTSDRLKALVGA